jgi:translation elongation factor EF-1beta
LDESTLDVEVPPENENEAIERFGHLFKLDITPADFDVDFSEFVSDLKSIISAYFSEETIKWLSAEQILVAYGSWKVFVSFRVPSAIDVEELVEYLENDHDDILSSIYSA